MPLVSTSVVALVGGALLEVTSTVALVAEPPMAPVERVPNVGSPVTALLVGTAPDVHPPLLEPFGRALVDPVEVVEAPASPTSTVTSAPVAFALASSIVRPPQPLTTATISHANAGDVRRW
jgi:hypothetical protein